MQKPNRTMLSWVITKTAAAASERGSRGSEDLQDDFASLSKSERASLSSSSSQQSAASFLFPHDAAPMGS